MSETGLIRAYSGLTRVLAPVLPFWLKRRALKGKEDAARQGERFGRASLPRPQGQVFWMHGASVGEVTMLLPLIDKMLAEYPKAHVLVTSGTVTSANLMQKRLPSRAFHQYIPLDTPKAVNGFLDHWQPDMALWAESEIWPNLIMQTKARNIPMALINARMSKKSLAGWQKRPGMAKALFGAFGVILCADDMTAVGLSKITGRNLTPIGNLKDGGAPLPFDLKELLKLEQAFGARPIWCAASSHKGEEEIILAAHEAIRKTMPNAGLVLALRHPERAVEIMPLLAQTPIAIRSRGDRPRKNTSVYLFDTIGEMGLAYRLSSIAFVCGSLKDGLMGHNPLEPAQLRMAVISGPHIKSFADIYAQMIEFGDAVRIIQPNMIAKTILGLWANDDALRKAGNQALAFAERRSGMLDKVWDKLTPVLPRASS